MPRRIVAWLSATLLAVSPVCAQSPERPLCDVGSSIVELIHFEVTPRKNERGPINPVDLRSSIIFLAECPSSFIRAFSDFPEEAELRRAWIDAVRVAAGDTSNVDVRAFLVAAQVSVARLGDHTLNEYLDGIFDSLPRAKSGKGSPLEPLFERQAAATLTRYTQCDGAGCFDASDIVLFLLGTHPLSVLKAMRANADGATRWLRKVADESFAGDPDRRDSREAARRDVLRRLLAVNASGFETEQRACEDTLARIRYRAVD
jgi:hypothetical protein